MIVNDLTQKYLDEIMRFLGLTVFKQASFIEDTQQNTDIIMIESNRIRYACRIRRFSYYKNYNFRNEFTIRSKTKYNKKTEIDKVLEGWGDFFIYGFENECCNGLQKITVSDLAVFRKVYNEKMGSYHNNHDGTGFLSFRWDEFPSEFIVNKMEVEPVQNIIIKPLHKQPIFNQVSLF